MFFDVPPQLSNKAGIYEIRNLYNGHVYVGSAVCFVRRYRQHLSDLRNGKHKNGILQAAFHKYGSDALCFHQLEVVDDKAKLIEAEQRHLDVYFDGKRCCYNISPTAASNFGLKMRPDSIEKRRATMRRLHEAGLPGPRYGVKLTEETKRRIAAAHFGVATRSGCHLSEDTKNKISAAKLGKSVLRKNYNVDLRAPDGVNHPGIKDLKNFARAHGLSPDGLYKLVNGTYAMYHGWCVATPQAGNPAHTT